jgi:hypothetical protein
MLACCLGFLERRYKPDFAWIHPISLRSPLGPKNAKESCSAVRSSSNLSERIYLLLQYRICEYSGPGKDSENSTVLMIKREL